MYVFVCAVRHVGGREREDSTIHPVIVANEMMWIVLHTLTMYANYIHVDRIAFVQTFVCLYVGMHVFTCVCMYVCAIYLIYIRYIARYI